MHISRGWCVWLWQYRGPPEFSDDARGAFVCDHLLSVSSYLVTPFAAGHPFFRQSTRPYCGHGKIPLQKFIRCGWLRNSTVSRERPAAADPARPQSSSGSIGRLGCRICWQGSRAGRGPRRGASGKPRDPFGPPASTAESRQAQRESRLRHCRRAGKKTKQSQTGKLRAAPLLQLQ